ncbi:AraC family transcriptional regulator [Clostridium sp. MSJ-11]|uniref:AraC family transcriptional regulator n=1 Tax=Clostridium mobile TaxID=2841512 RepID=A0ABS6EGE3_9CLOT|nr:AraC family transcriptional regulator [Clostridium mobile]MBU5484259.1 AraC family transcriptional regulator [Clostridium mobile]
MNNVTYEKVNLNQNLPAFIRYVGKENFDTAKYSYIPPHWHRSIEITFVTEGKVAGVINGKSINVKSGEFIFVNSGDVHEIEKYPDQPSGAVILILSYEFIKKLYPNIDNIRLDIMKSNFKKDRLREIFLEMKEFCLHPKELDYIKVNSYIYEILYILLSNCIISKERDYTKNYFKYREKQKEILTYISENYKEELTLERISKHFYMSNEYFSRKFREWFGITYKAYLSNFRLHKAYEDIINSEVNIQDIAIFHGFSNVKSFINLFKKKYKMTPLKYRQYLKESKNDIKMGKKEQQ